MCPLLFLLMPATKFGHGKSLARVPVRGGGARCSRDAASSLNKSPRTYPDIVRAAFVGFATGPVNQRWGKWRQ